jgi:hypothetical protein
MRFEHTNTRTNLKFDCKLNCTRCTATTSKGTRCKRRVCVGVAVCHSHRKSLGVKVKQSNIANAGKGLFATKTFKKNAVIGSYSGENVSQAEINRRYGNSKRDNAPYALGASNANGRVLDSACSRSIMSIANSGRQRSRNNAKFSHKMKQDGTINVRATKKIEAGDEIMIWYGKDYWKSAKYSRHKTK